jgi:hypothetical protein
MNIVFGLIDSNAFLHRALRRILLLLATSMKTATPTSSPTRRPLRRLRMSWVTPDLGSDMLLTRMCSRSLSIIRDVPCSCISR